MHEALIRKTHEDRLVGHLSRDSTAIEAREKPAQKERQPEQPKQKRGRPKKGEERPKKLKRLQRQSTMTTQAMLDDLPTDCDVGTKKNSKVYKETWIGYKLHIDVADGQIPISCILTSASLHDSQAAIPLATLSAERTTNLYDLSQAARSQRHYSINPSAITAAGGSLALPSPNAGASLPLPLKSVARPRVLAPQLRLLSSIPERMLSYRVVLSPGVLQAALLSSNSPDPSLKVAIDVFQQSCIETENPAPFFEPVGLGFHLHCSPISTRAFHNYPGPVPLTNSFPGPGPPATCNQCVLPRCPYVTAFLVEHLYVKFLGQ